MRNYKKPGFIDAMDTRMEVVNAVSCGDEGGDEPTPPVDTRSEYCSERGLDHPTLLGCVLCRYSYTVNWKARCEIRNTFK